MRDWDWWEWILFPVAVAGLLATIAVCVDDCNEQERCEQRGGNVEHYNFRTILVATSCGSNCVMMIPEEVSDWRCVGLPAELAR